MKNQTNNNQYDAIAEQYHQSTLERDDRKYVLDPSIKHYLSYGQALAGKTVLDLGCGSGHYSRLAASMGAKVTALDSSAEEIKIAQNIERLKPSGIRYLTGDATKLPQLGQFDMALALFLLHYCKDRSELRAMCQSIYNNIKPGGRFLCFNNNPEHPVQDCLENYAYSITGPQPLKEGDQLTVCLALKDGSQFSFNHYYWAKETYEQALIAAGFKKEDIHWRRLIVSNEGIKQFPAGFWNEYIMNSNPIALDCRKR